MINGLLNQTVTIQPQSSYSEDGREVVGNAVTETWRVQPISKTIFSPRGALERGSLLTIDAIGYAPKTTVAEIDAKITVGSEVYKVYSKYPVPGRDGQTHHVKVQLLRWQT